MKICPSCHTANEDTAQNCKNCNRGLQYVLPQNSSQPQHAQQQPAVLPVPEQKKKNSVLIVIIIMFFLTVITGMILVFFYLNNKLQAQSPEVIAVPETETVLQEPDTTEPEVTPVLIPVTEEETVPETEAPATAAVKAPEISCNIQVQANPPYDGFTYTLMVNSGSYDYYYVECDEYSGGSLSAYPSLSGRYSEKALYLTAGSSLDHVTATVTPYYSDGTSGKPVTCTAKQPSYLGQGTPVTGTGKMILRTVPNDSGDSSGSTTITKIADGSEIEIYSTDDSRWRYIIYGSYAGYAKTEYAKLYSEISSSSSAGSSVPMPSDASYLGQGTPVTGTGKMILRTVPDDSGDDSGSTTITKIKDGSEISIYSTGSSSWRYVVYGSYAGYAKTQYARLYSEINGSSGGAGNVSMPSDAVYLGNGTPSTGTGKVILRSSMDDSSDSNIITKIKDGSSVTVYDVGSSKWYYITYAGSYSGYAKIQYIKLA